MTSTSSSGGMQIVAGGEYQPGVCNIGPAEIQRRRRAGHVGLAATIGLLAVLLLIDAPPLLRLLIAIPAAVSASGYLQATLKFCAGFGQLGVFNFGETGTQTAVVDETSRAADRRRARQIGLMSFAVGAIVALVAVLLPV
jgi:ferric-dicitrate binding protein FerR (iron transport regulator)